MNEQPTVRLVSQSDKGLECCAAAARLSTTPSPAHALIDARQGGDKDRALVRKVLSSGHRSLIEHHQMTYALDGISVLAEQFLIECRLCAFTVKSRRYVDFENAGFYVPALSQPQSRFYCQAMADRFRDYAALTELGIPREDARFVLPYCFHSSLYLSANAREMALIIGHLLWGRGRAFPELTRLGALMAQPFEQVFPGVLEAMRPIFDGLASPPMQSRVGDIAPCQGQALLLSAPEDGAALLRRALAFSGRLAPDDLRGLVSDARPRELEMLNYAFCLKNVSLACVTHIARHRIQSPLFAPTLTAVNRQRYILPPSIAGNPQALCRYQSAFEAQRETAQSLTAEGLSPQDLSYLALSGLTVDLMTSMNARELLHFIKLRTCTRAQWEVRDLAGQMLTQLRGRDPQLFALYGPSCFVSGICPEGRLSCGRAPAKT